MREGKGEKSNSTNRRFDVTISIRPKPNQVNTSTRPDITLADTERINRQNKDIESEINEQQKRQTINLVELINTGNSSNECAHADWLV